MKNLQESLFGHIGGANLVRRVKCIYVDVKGPQPRSYSLPINWDDDDLNNFYRTIDGNIDDKHYIYGTIWFEDGTWSTSFGDGDWRYQACPRIPRECR